MTIRSDALADLLGTGPIDLVGQWAGRAFLCYDQSNLIVRSSGNVSSVTDAATGDHDVNFTTAFTSFDYAVLFGTRNNRTLGRDTTLVTTTHYSAQHRTLSGTLIDDSDNNHLVVGELAT